MKSKTEKSNEAKTTKAEVDSESAPYFGVDTDELFTLRKLADSLIAWDRDGDSGDGAIREAITEIKKLRRRRKKH